MSCAPLTTDGDDASATSVLADEEEDDDCSMSVTCGDALTSPLPPPLATSAADSVSFAGMARIDGRVELACHFVFAERFGADEPLDLRGAGARRR